WSAFISGDEHAVSSKERMCSFFTIHLPQPSQNEGDDFGIVCEGMRCITQFSAPKVDKNVGQNGFLCSR
ncbi:MAG: hypothetical protein ACREBR_00135, partial [bacterium]